MYSFPFRLIKEFDREIKEEESKNSPEVSKKLNDEKQSMVRYIGTCHSHEPYLLISPHSCSFLCAIYLNT